MPTSFAITGTSRHVQTVSMAARSAPVSVAILLHQFLKTIQVNNQSVCGNHIKRPLNLRQRKIIAQLRRAQIGIERTSGAQLRKLLVRPLLPALSRAIRCDPTPMAIPSACAASARWALIFSALNGPPVIELMRKGAVTVCQEIQWKGQNAASPSQAGRCGSTAPRPRG